MDTEDAIKQTESDTSGIQLSTGSEAPTSTEKLNLERKLGERQLEEIPKPGNNDPCHCGSERKYKKCCKADDEYKVKEAEEERASNRMLAMCEGKIPFDQVSAIKLLTSHSASCKSSHDDDIKYLKSLKRALLQIPMTAIELHGEHYEVTDIIDDIDKSIAELSGSLARKDYLIEEALALMVEKLNK
jgi:hypothetical protein